MTSKTINMKNLYRKLSDMGFSRNYVQQIALPQWWDKEFEQTSGAAVEAAAYISRRLNLDLNSLLQPNQQPAFDTSYQAKFKVQNGTNQQKLSVACSLAVRVAEMVAYACVRPYHPTRPLSAQDVRSQILRNNKFIDLESLLQWCWHRGIPVFHCDRYPHNTPKFHGMVVCCHSQTSNEGCSRPVIAISHAHKSPSRLLFILAHELGHLLQGHVTSDRVLMDEIEFSHPDKEETEANNFAVELLSGRWDANYKNPIVLTGEQLANYAKAKSWEDRVDPGFVINNYGWHMQEESNKNCWPAVEKALKCVENSQNAPETIARYLSQEIDWHRLSDDNQEYLKMQLFY
jgi:hypothetical protein